MKKYLDSEGVKTLWGKIKSSFLEKEPTALGTSGAYGFDVLTTAGEYYSANKDVIKSYYPTDNDSKSYDGPVGLLNATQIYLTVRRFGDRATYLYQRLTIKTDYDFSIYERVKNATSWGDWIWQAQDVERTITMNLVDDKIKFRGLPEGCEDRVAIMLGRYGNRRVRYRYNLQGDNHIIFRARKRGWMMLSDHETVSSPKGDVLKYNFNNLTIRATESGASYYVYDAKTATPTGQPDADMFFKTLTESKNGKLVNQKLGIRLFLYADDYKSQLVKDTGWLPFRITQDQDGIFHLSNWAVSGGTILSV